MKTESCIGQDLISIAWNGSSIFCWRIAICQLYIWSIMWWNWLYWCLAVLIVVGRLAYLLGILRIFVWCSSKGSQYWNECVVIIPNPHTGLCREDEVQLGGWSSFSWCHCDTSVSMASSVVSTLSTLRNCCVLAYSILWVEGWWMSVVLLTLWWISQCSWCCRLSLLRSWWLPWLLWVFCSSWCLFCDGASDLGHQWLALGFQIVALALMPLTKVMILACQL